MKAKTNKYEILGSATIIYSSNTEDKILIDTEDLDKVKEHCWSVKEDSPLHRYARTRLKGTKNFVLMHRVILNAQQGDIVDHLNHNTLDNTKRNIILTNHSENLKNKIKYAYADRGINYQKNCPLKPWRAMYCNTYIGWFSTREEAILARINYLKENKIYVKGSDYHL